MRKVLYTTLVIALLCSCGKNNEPEPVPPTPPAAELPEPPSEMNANNAFCVDYFTDLKDENSYFVRRDIGIAKNHILGEEGNRVGGKRSSFLPTFVFRPLTPPYVRFRIRRFFILRAI